MYGWCTLLKETSDSMVIGYSWQKDSSYNRKDVSEGEAGGSRKNRFHYLRK